MSKEERSTLTDLVFALAKDAVGVQARLDAEICLQREAFAKGLADVPSPELRQALAALAPLEQRVTSFRVSCEVRRHTQRSFDGGFRVTPINLAYRAVIGSSEARSMAFRVDVEPVLPFTVPEARGPEQ